VDRHRETWEGDLRDVISRVEGKECELNGCGKLDRKRMRRVLKEREDPREGVQAVGMVLIVAKGNNGQG
jgi:hypothetical protein